jgi:hypothetical protein
MIADDKRRTHSGMFDGYGALAGCLFFGVPLIIFALVCIGILIWGAIVMYGLGNVFVNACDLVITDFHHR